MPFLTQREDTPRVPYKSHPLYRLRRLTLFALALSAVTLLLLHSVSYYYYNSYVLFFGLIFFSALFIVYDLISWAIEKLHLRVEAFSQAIQHLQETRGNTDDIPSHHGGNNNDDDAQKPEWPRKHIMIGDFLFALIFQFPFWGLLAFSLSQPGYYDSGPSVMGAYAALAALIVSVLHGIAWRKQLAASRKAKLSKALQAAHRECSNCGHVSCPVAETAATALHEHSQAGPSTHRNAKPVQPRWVSGKKKARAPVDLESGLRSAAGSEDSLLIAPTPEESSSEATMRKYGTLENSVQSLKSDGEEMVGKKGKRRVVGEDWYGKDKDANPDHEIEG